MLHDLVCPFHTKDFIFDESPVRCDYFFKCMFFLYVRLDLFVVASLIRCYLQWSACVGHLSAKNFAYSCLGIFGSSCSEIFGVVSCVAVLFHCAPCSGPAPVPGQMVVNYHSAVLRSVPSPSALLHIFSPSLAILVFHQALCSSRCSSAFAPPPFH